MRVLMTVLACLALASGAWAEGQVHEAFGGESLPIAVKPANPNVRRAAAQVGEVDTIPGGRPLSSSSIAIGRDVDLGSILWSANGNADSVSIVVLDAFGTGQKFDTFVFGTGAGSEPTNVAVTSDGLSAWITLRGRGVVLPMSIDKVRGLVRFGTAIPVGSEPYGIVLDTLGRNLYVANSTEGTVSVINVQQGRVVARLFLGDGVWPFALAVKPGLATSSTAAGEKIYVTQFFSKAAKFNNGGETDDSRIGKVTVLREGRIAGAVDLKPFACFPFPAGSGQKITGFPNQLNSIVVRGRYAFVVSVGASPARPVNFVANTQAFVHVFDTETDREVSAINLNEPVEEEAPKGLFFNTPWGIAFSNAADEGYVLSAASNIAVKIKVNTATGVPTITGPAIQGGSIKGIRRIPVGKNPRGVIFSTDGRIAYVHNYISRDISVIGLATDRVVNKIPLARQPTDARLKRLLHGEELYNTSLSRMSTNGWGSCFSCHPFGWTDTVVWNFADGPRKTLPTIGRALANPRDPTRDVRMLNWSAVRDELEDFEQNIRKVSSKFVADNQADDGKTGLMPGVSGSPNSPLGPQDIFDIVKANGTPAKPNAGRTPDWDDLAEYMRSVRSPISPIRLNDPRVTAGAKTFDELGCTECHAGAKWTSSIRPYNPATLSQAGADRIRQNAAQVVEVLRDVGTFVATEETAAVVNGVAGRAKGAAGFNPPSLIGAWAFPPFFHNGSSGTLAQALVRHAKATESPQRKVIADRTLRNPAAMANLELFVRTIDDRTPARTPLPRPTVTTTVTGTARTSDEANSFRTKKPGTGTGDGTGTSTGSGTGTGSGDTGVPALLDDEIPARLSGSGAGDRKYRAVAPGEGIQLVKLGDAFGGTGGAVGATSVRGVIFTANRNGTFSPSTGGATTISLRQVSTGRTFTARDGSLAGTGQPFNYLFPSLQPGAYHVNVQRAGFAPRETRVAVTVEAGLTLVIDVFLLPAR
jgi:DNA-binding beta-propeller fold protein YncE